MSQQPLVSCIIIFLNAEQYFAEAIDSVLAQTYSNWELLLVDDGSQDSSTDIARSYANHHPESIFYLQHMDHKNLGMSASRNLGIEHSKGEYIAFLDADDIWLDSKLKEQVDIICAYPEAGMVYGRALLWYSWLESNNNSSSLCVDHTIALGVEPNQLVMPPRILPGYAHGQIPNSYSI